MFGKVAGPAVVADWPVTRLRRGLCWAGGGQWLGGASGGGEGDRRPPARASALPAPPPRVRPCSPASLAAVRLGRAAGRPATAGRGQRRAAASLPGRAPAMATAGRAGKTGEAGVELGAGLPLTCGTRLSCPP